ncbi:MAG: GNAT family N-acetyltransferase [Thermoplasmata archaeon]|nr:GNAT family N-acetyltransferase [Thermoplasmata archaeon]
MSITIRNINKETDLENFVEFCNQAYVDYPEFKPLTIDIARQYVYDTPDFDEMGNFFAIKKSRIIGRARGDVHAETGTIVISILPELRYTGIEDMLFDAVMKYLAPNNLEKIRVMILSKFTEMSEFYKSKGFQEKNRMYDMVRNMSRPVEVPKLPDGIIIEVPDLKKEYEAVKDTIEIGFSDTMDEATATEMMEQYDNFTKADYFSKDGIFAARDANGNILGICVAAVHPAMEDKGFIPWLAVLKEHRGKGIGKALLLSSLEWFKGQDNITKSELSVDLDNPNALGLYNGIGYEVITETILLEKIQN